MSSNIIGKIISEALIEFNESIGKEAVFFLTHLVKECTNVDDIKEQFKLFCMDSSLLNKDNTDIEETFKRILNNLKHNEFSVPIKK